MNNPLPAKLKAMRTLEAALTKRNEEIKQLKIENAELSKRLGGPFLSPEIMRHMLRIACGEIVDTMKDEQLSACMVAYCVNVTEERDRLRRAVAEAVKAS